MPTRNRRRFARQAIWYFLRQTWEPRELIVIDDGQDAIADLIPGDDRIRYIRLDQPLRRGAKRNIGCELARGDLIAHWDDDDWIAPDRLSQQVQALASGNVAVCGATDLLHYAVESGQAWQHRPAANGRPHLAGATLLYRRDTWATLRFPDRDVGDDRALLDALPVDALRPLPDAAFYIALLHGGNTAPRNLSDPAWERRSIDEVTGRLAADQEFYITIRHGDRPRSPVAQPSTSSVTLHAPFMLYDGYGSLSEYLLRGMTQAGARVNTVPARFDPSGYDDDLLEMIRHAQPEPGAPTLLSGWILEPLGRYQSSGGLVMNTMWETSRLPDGTAANLNQANALAVPSRFVADMFRACGVTVPIEVVPYGIDPHRYPHVERPQREGITTLTVGTFVPRKNIDEGIAAWKIAFAGDPHARLIIKTRFRVRPYVPDDPRIQFVDAEETTRGIAHWYAQADVLLTLGSEGFGLPLVEGMATGLPVVALNAEGQADVCQDAASLGCLLPVPAVRQVQFDDPPFGPCGLRSVPDITDIAERLHWVNTHRAEAREMGRLASAWVTQHRNIWSLGPAMLDMMERHIQPARPLRRVRALWTVNGPVSPAVAAHTVALVARLPEVRVVQHLSELRGVRLVQIHVHPLAADDAGISAVARRARHAGVPVVIVEHAVASHARAWEYEADALVALTPEDAATLRRRWPGKRVDLISPGDGDDDRDWAAVVEQYLSLWQDLERSSMSMQAQR
jgi:glycosyltransferase involved in cell wall biosynthesis